MEKNKFKKNILVISDLVSNGDVALSSQMTVLSSYGYKNFSLPTSIISNVFDLGKVEICDTTDYMEKTMNLWMEFGFEFDGVIIGYILNERQMMLIRSFIEKLKKSSRLKYVLLDPIMADCGSLYKGEKDTKIDLMKKMSKVADIIIPNYTEAVLMSGLSLNFNKLTYDELDMLLNKLYEQARTSVVITSVPLEDSKSVVIYDGKEVLIHNYEEIDVHCIGIGDFFTADFFSNFLITSSLSKSAMMAIENAKSMIEKNL